MREVVRAAEELAGDRQTCGMEQADSLVEQLGSTQSGAERALNQQRAQREWEITLAVGVGWIRRFARWANRIANPGIVIVVRPLWATCCQPDQISSLI